MKQTQMQIYGKGPGAILDVPGLGEYFRVALYGQTIAGVEKVVVRTVELQKGILSGMDGSDFSEVWQFTADALLHDFSKAGWNSIRFIKVPEPRIVPQPSQPWKPQIREGK